MSRADALDNTDYTISSQHRHQAWWTLLYILNELQKSHDWIWMMIRNHLWSSYHTLHNSSKAFIYLFLLIRFRNQIVFIFCLNQSSCAKTILSSMEGRTKEQWRQCNQTFPTNGKECHKSPEHLGSLTVCGISNYFNLQCIAFRHSRCWNKHLWIKSTADEW